MTNRAHKASKKVTKKTQKRTEQKDKDEIDITIEAPSIWEMLTDRLWIEVTALNELRPKYLNMESDDSGLLTTIRSDKALIDLKFNPAVPVILYTVEGDPNPVSTDKRKGKLTFGIEDGQVWLHKEQERLTLETVSKYVLDMLT